MPEGFFGINGVQILLAAEMFATPIRELTVGCVEGTLAEVLTGLNCM